MRLLIPAAVIWSGLSSALLGREIIDKSTCEFKGHQLYGKIQLVESFPDITVEVVRAFPDLKVKLVEAFPNRCGEWQMVTSFPDTKVKIVESFGDIKVEFVDSFPGIAR
jgi:hypothetical protein